MPPESQSFTWGRLLLLAVLGSYVIISVVLLAGSTAGVTESPDKRATDERSAPLEAGLDGQRPSIPTRVVDGLVLLYDFGAGQGATVSDIAGRASGLDLTIANPSAVTWTDTGLRFDQPTIATTNGAPTALYDRILDTQELTVEAWITPADTAQNGPARIVTLGEDTTATNLLLGQGAYGGGGDQIEVRLHERIGTWQLRTGGGTLDDGLTHVVMTRTTEGTVTVYLNGQRSAQAQMAATLDGWNPAYQLAIGAELTGERAWLGIFHQLAIYDTALTPDQITTNYTAGPLPDTISHARPEPEPDPELRAQDDRTVADRDRSPAPVDGTCNGSTASVLTRHGITWTFDGEYVCGRYANGDPWVVGPVSIVDIDPPSTTSGGRTINGAMINPSPRDGGQLGYGQMRDIGYDPSKNVAYGVSATDPLLVAPHSSLVSTISVAEADGRPGIETAAVLTVVDEAPVPDAFRPPYSGDDKTARFTTDQLRGELLPRLDHVEGTPDIAGLATSFERVWLDHVPGWTGRSIHPTSAMPDYGRDLASQLGKGSLVLMLDFTDAEKRDLLVRFVQIGIDLYGIVEDGGAENWVPNGGHAQGRKWPILFAGHLLGDPAMASIGQRDDVHFGEDDQTFYVTHEDIERGVGYTSADIGLPEWGIRHATDPSRDDPSWDASYRQCCTANSWGGHVLSARIMGLKGAWNHDPLFDYTDRFLDRQPTGIHDRFWDRPFTEAMWDTYRDQR